jgi:hypothetical protein
MLNQQNSFDNLILPIFKELMEQDIISCIYNSNGQKLIATAKYQELFCSQINQNPATPKSKSPYFLDFEINLAKLVNLTIHKRIVLNAIAIIPLVDHHNSYLFTYLPLFQQNQIIAVQAIIQEIDLVPLLNFNAQICGLISPDERQTASPKLTLKLSKRQKEILFLITLGFSQQTVAEILGIKRGTVAKIVSDHLCPKFAIPQSNTKLLAKLARAAGVHTLMPHSLLQPQLIILSLDAALSFK